MKADFSGYATKAGIKCSDGRTIMPDAFKHQDKMRVPLVWQHGHTEPENVLGHVILENRNDGVYAYGYFNKSARAVHTAGLVEHKDINALSIWANQLIERAGKVIHGAIREVSLVLAGANPGALIENVTIRHSDGDDQVLDDEVIIHTGLEIETDTGDSGEEVQTGVETNAGDENKPAEEVKTGVQPSSDDQSNTSEDDNLEHAAADATIQDVFDTLNEDQLNVVHYMIGQALESASNAQHSNTDNTNNTAVHGDTQEGKNMTNVFEKKDGPSKTVLSHDDMKQIVAAAVKTGSLKDAVDDYAIAHGITDIDTLFPDSRTISNVPEWVKRRTEWVDILLTAVRKSPFSRIKTITADLTFEEARAKGYVKGAMKKEEYFGVAKRVTTPTTIYKKQALDRDDMIDITDFDVVAWLKAEMRLMIDEELARAMLVGDGRDIASEDKINEQNIRPIAKDNELYTTTVNVNIDDAASSMLEVLDAVITNRSKLKGTGMPTFFTTEYWIARFLLLRDNNNARMYKTLGELAAELRCASVVAVEALLEEEDIVGIMVNPTDYVLGADKGGEVNMFDDFDIDYNKQKYLIETRVSGALVKPKSALVIRRTAGTDVVVVPAAPAYDAGTGALTITNQTGVVYKNGAGTVVNAAGSPYTVTAGTTYVVNATPAAGYYFATSDDDSWSFTRPV